MGQWKFCPWQEQLPKRDPTRFVHLSILCEYAESCPLNGVQCTRPLRVLFLMTVFSLSLQQNDSSFMVVDLDSLFDRFSLWKRELPHIEPFYAVKCNNDETFLRSLAAMGVGFDCASRGEIDDVLRLGVSPDRIVYAHPCKSPSFISHAYNHGVDLLTFDNHEELNKIAVHQTCPQLLLRIAVSDPTARYPLASKFGADPKQKAPQLLKYAADLGLPVVGVCFHVGSEANDPSAYRLALEQTKRLFTIGLSFGHKMQIVDVGGGFPGREYTPSFEKFAASIRSAVHDIFPDPNVRLIAEPGRFFAERPFTLVASVMARTAVSAERITKKSCDASSTGHMYYINDGVYGNFICGLTDNYYPPGRPLFDDENGELFPSLIWGPTCDSHDRLEDNKMMRRLEVGDWIIYEDMGAYTSAVSTTFNGFQRPTPIYFISESRW
ncbi:hypothetical protein PENTCL1PPCAC_11885, partial [Pristionchus entomophagus]